MYPRTMTSMGKTFRDRTCMQRPRKAARSVGEMTEEEECGDKLRR